MKSSVAINLMLAGIVVALVVLLIDSRRDTQSVYGQGVGAAAGGVIAVTGDSGFSGSHLLWLIDTKREALSVYAYHRGGVRGGAVNGGKLEFLASREFRYDLQTNAYQNAGAKVSDVKEAVLKNEDLKKK